VWPVWTQLTLAVLSKLFHLVLIEVFDLSFSLLKAYVCLSFCQVLKIESYYMFWSCLQGSLQWFTLFIQNFFSLLNYLMTRHRIKALMRTLAWSVPVSHVGSAYKGAQADQILASFLYMNSFPCGSSWVHGNVTWGEHGLRASRGWKHPKSWELTPWVNCIIHLYL